MKALKIFLGLGVLGSAAVHADTIRLGEPSANGTGCPIGSVAASLSPDQKALSLLFSEYVADSGFRGSDYKTCNIAIPIHVPQGYSLSIIGIDYRGFVSLPRGATARFTADYFFAGSRGPRTTRMWRGPLDDDYIIEDDLLARATVWSRCGADVILRANTNMFLRSNYNRDPALATVDTVDVDAGIIYQLQWKRCY